MTGDFTSVATPDGPFVVVARDGAVIAAGWTDRPADLMVAVHPDLRPDRLEPVPVNDADADAADQALGAAVAAIESYYCGDPSGLDVPPVRQRSSAFRMKVWEVLRQVPAGETVTYGELAEMAGQPRAARAAGSACANNAVALLVPCHRVIAAGGRLGGYGSRPDHKRRLLRRENVWLRA